jgi:hypothetical protein
MNLTQENPAEGVGEKKFKIFKAILKTFIGQIAFC